MVRPPRSSAARFSAMKLMLATACVVSAAACGGVIDTAVDRAANRTAEGIGDAVGTRVGQMAGSYIASRIPAVWTPDLSALYVNYLLSVAFHSGGYTVADAEYEPGEWTRWRVTSADSEQGQPPEIERAFLDRRGDGNEWWRVKYVADAENEQGAADRDSLNVEMLLNRETGEVLRMRGRMPGDAEAKEMPVQEGTYTFTRPTRLTRESVEGARVGTETVRVPAGRFSAEHVRYGDISSGTLEWWLVGEQVPGDMVRYLRRADGTTGGDGPDAHEYTVELVDYGDGARSELGVQD